MLRYFSKNYFSINSLVIQIFRYILPLSVTNRISREREELLKGQPDTADGLVQIKMPIIAERHNTQHSNGDSLKILELLKESELSPKLLKVHRAVYEIGATLTTSK